jgi:hypothetical protein
MYSTAKLIYIVGDVMVWNEERNVQTQRNWFSRLVRGLSSSLPEFGATRNSENSRPFALPEEEPEQFSGPHKTFVASSVWSENSEDLFAIDSSEESDVKDGSRMPFPLLSVPQMGSLMEQSKQRLAGHTAKIRLETPPTLEPLMISETPREILDVSSLAALGKTEETASPMVRQMISETPREILDVSSLSSLPAALDRMETDIRVPVGYPEVAKQEAVSSHLPTRNDINKTADGNQRHLPTGRMFKGNIRIVTRNPLCGSGEFSCGQSNAVIKNPAIRASSVIVVTLTSNPGPVAVHYVSLLPYESFTVHLTAPATMHARFNYIIFSGELT